MRTIVSYAQLLAEHADGWDPEAQEFLQKIEKAGVFMTRLIQDLLAYSRLSRIELPLESLEVQSALNEVLAEMSQEISNKQAGIQLDALSAHVVAHHTTLCQILANLISNALKFVPAGVPPKIQVCAEPHQNFVRISVIDNGIGIAPKYHERIFKVFERLHCADDYPGTGIGLAIVRKAAERMNGRAGVQSDQGKGSTFWIELPAANRG